MLYRWLSPNNRVVAINPSEDEDARQNLFKTSALLMSQHRLALLKTRSEHIQHTAPEQAPQHGAYFNTKKWRVHLFNIPGSGTMLASQHTAEHQHGMTLQLSGSCAFLPLPSILGYTTTDTLVWGRVQTPVLRNGSYFHTIIKQLNLKKKKT